MGAIALDPLIAEAKRRARWRRLLIVGVIAAGAVAAVVVIRDSAGSRPAVVAAPTCRSAQLRISGQPWGAAAGTMYEPVTLTNASGSACSVAGWPAVRRLGADGREIPVRLERWVYRLRGAAPYFVLRLAPGRAATFEIFGEDWNHRLDQPCREALTIQVMTRGRGRWLSLPARPADRGRGIPACRSWLLGPLVPGKVANPPVAAYSLWRRAHRT